MARQPRALDEATPVVEPVTETITYVPGQMDPSHVKWAGHTFQANIPKEITGHAEGSERERLNMHVIERARENKQFVVGNAPKARRDRNALPKTSDEYKAYMIEWMKDPALDHAAGLIGRFFRDRDLQAMCEVGGDDFAYLGTLFMPKLHELARADELTEGQVAQLWVNAGFNQLPW